MRLSAYLLSQSLDLRLGVVLFVLDFINSGHDCVVDSSLFKPERLWCFLGASSERIFAISFPLDTGSLPFSVLVVEAYKRKRRQARQTNILLFRKFSKGSGVSLGGFDCVPTILVS